MALNADVLAQAMKDAVDAVPVTDTATMRPALFHALASAIVGHIQTAAEVVVTSVSGVTPGGGVSGPGTGTIT